MLLFLIVTLILCILVYLCFKRVPDYERLVLIRMGRPIGVKGPGWVLVFPSVDKVLRVEIFPPPVGKKTSKNLVPMQEANEVLAQALLKKRGLTDTEVDKSSGFVVVDGVRWEAFSSGWIQSAAPVAVVGVENLRLKLVRVGN
jgi:regulator of protease activity HflC (stomatin/prohibitin superfamily)